MQGSEIRRWEENKMFLSLDPSVSACKGDREDKHRSFGGWISAKWPCLSSSVSLKKKENDNDTKHTQGMVNYKQSINKTAILNNSIVKLIVMHSHTLQISNSTSVEPTVKRHFWWLHPIIHHTGQTTDHCLVIYLAAIRLRSTFSPDMQFISGFFEDKWY